MASLEQWQFLQTRDEPVSAETARLILRGWKEEREHYRELIRFWSYCTRLGANATHETRRFAEMMREEGFDIP